MPSRDSRHTTAFHRYRVEKQALTKEPATRYRDMLTAHLQKKRSLKGTSTNRARSAYARFIAKQGHNIHKITAKDSTGRRAYYFVYVRKSREKNFMKAIDGDGMIDLDEYGKVIGSCYGEEPSEDLKRELFDKYGFEV